MSRSSIGTPCDFSRVSRPLEFESRTVRSTSAAGSPQRGTPSTVTGVRDVAVLVGSLRKASFSRRTALALSELAPAGLRLAIVEIGQLPLYDQDADDEGRPPRAWLSFRERIKAADAVLFVTPEYNRSVPGALKNAIDVGSRPYGSSVWNGKPGAVISVSPGGVGGFGAN